MFSVPALSARRRGFAVLFATLAVGATGSGALGAVMPAIGRQIGAPDALIPAVYSLSALLWTVCSPKWARLSDRKGRKPLVALGVAGFVVSMLAFALATWAGLQRLAPWTLVFPALVLARALFGFLASAAVPAATAWVTERTEHFRRCKAMASLASATSLGTVLGPALAPLLLFPGLGLAGPMAAFALIGAVLLFVVLRGLPENRAEAPADGAPPEAEPASRGMWKDPRLLPFVLFGFLLASAQAVNAQALGFLVIDMVRRSPAESQGLIAAAMLASAAAVLFAQRALIPLLRLSPRALLPLGAGLAAAGNLITAAAPGFGALVAGYVVMSLGYGLARPGWIAGASLSVGPREQASAAGVMTAIDGAVYIAGPVLGMALYQWLQPAPFVLNVALGAALVGYALGSPVLRRAGGQVAPKPVPARVDDAVRAAA